MSLLPGRASAEGVELFQTRAPADYNHPEQQFSAFIQRRIYRLLKGEDNAFMLMRRYEGAGLHDRHLAFLLPDAVDAAEIRPQVAEKIIYSVLRFLDPFAPGGPIAQSQADGQITEIQTFPTQYPHIIVEREDVFDEATRVCTRVEWRAVRLQNQRKQTLVNRALDLGNLALELGKIVAPGG